MPTGVCKRHLFSTRERGLGVSWSGEQWDKSLPVSTSHRLGGRRRGRTVSPPLLASAPVGVGLWLNGPLCQASPVITTAFPRTSSWVTLVPSFITQGKQCQITVHLGLLLGVLMIEHRLIWKKLNLIEFHSSRFGFSQFLIKGQRVNLVLWTSCDLCHIFFLFFFSVFIHLKIWKPFLMPGQL